MRNLGWFILGIGLFALVVSIPAQAQDKPSSGLKVLVGPDGVIKVIELSDKPATPLAKPRTGSEPKGTDLEKQVERLRKELQQAEERLRIDRALRELEEELRILSKAKKDSKPAESKKEQKDRTDWQWGWKGWQGPGGWQGSGGWSGKPPTGSGTVEQKLDKLIKEVDELRREVKQLKERLGAPKDKKSAGQPPKPFDFQFQFPMLPGGVEKGKKEIRIELDSRDPLTDPAIRRALEWLRKSDGGGVQIERFIEIGPQTPTNREQHIRQLLQQVEQLQREVQKLKARK